jgi:hypothetical protein
MALVAIILAATSGVLCLSAGYAAYCLPLVALILGIVAWTNARRSLDPARTLNWARISVITMSVAIGLLVLACLAVIVIAIVAGVIDSATQQ